MLDRPRLTRSQFVFTEVRGRPAIFWQTRNAAKAANPGARVPRARALTSGFTIAVDTRERYGYRFANRDVQTDRVGRAQDARELRHVAVRRHDGLPDAAALGDPDGRGRRRGPLPRALTLEHVRGAWLADVLARLQIRYPEVQVVFADSRKFAEEWTYRFLAAALARRLCAEPARTRT